MAYNVYFSEDGNQMTIVHIHPDAASLDLKTSNVYCSIE